MLFSSTLRSSLTVFVFFLALFTLTAGGHLYSPDEEIMFRTTEALAKRAGFAIEPMVDPASGRSFATRRGVQGKEFAQYGIANSLFALPFYYAGQGLARLVPESTARQWLDFDTASLSYLPATAPRGKALLLRFAVSFFGLFVAAATCTLIWRFCLGVAQSGESALPPSRALRTAWLVALAYGAGTMAWPHSRTFFSEPLATFFTLMAFYLAWQNRNLSLGGLLGCSASFALALLTRLDSVVVLPALVLFVTTRYLELQLGDKGELLQAQASDLLHLLRERGFWLRMVMLAIPLLGFGLIQLGLNWGFYGHPLASGYSDQPEGIHFSTPLLAGLYGFFFSVGKSVFLFSPALVLGMMGFSSFWKRHFSLALASLTAIVLLLLFHSRWQNWAGGWCWGPRHIFMAHVFAILPVMGFVEGWTRFRRLIYGAVMAAAVAVQLYGSSQSFIDFYVLYYRTPHNPPWARVMYSNEDMNPRLAQAPFNDSIYVPQNSQWPRYAEMQRMGFSDNLWLRLWRNR